MPAAGLPGIANGGLASIGGFTTGGARTAAPADLPPPPA